MFLILILKALEDPKAKDNFSVNQKKEVEKFERHLRKYQLKIIDFENEAKIYQDYLRLFYNDYNNFKRNYQDLKDSLIRLNPDLNNFLNDKRVINILKEHANSILPKSSIDVKKEVEKVVKIEENSSNLEQEQKVSFKEDLGR